MKHSLAILFTIGTLFSDGVRYLDEVFEDVIKTEDVVYGNAPDLPFIFLFEWNTYDVDLDMDIYEPAGDTLTNRPVIIFVHTGAFFSGHNELDDMVALSTAAAKRGYVAVSLNYRLGLNILSSYSAERAVYRGVQDGSAAIRFLKEYSGEFGIDPDNIFMWGSSAGSFIALHLAFTQDDERPEATYGNWQDPDLGCIDCEGNDYNHIGKPKAIISCWGAIGDLEWIDPEDSIPTLMFHGSADPVVPINSGFPLLDIALPIVYGSNMIHDRLSSLNLENEIQVEEGELHEYWGTVNGNWFGGPSEFWYDILEDGFTFLYNQLELSDFHPGDECTLDDGETGFMDCELCCWDTGLLSWLGDGYCDSMGGCAWEGPQYDCLELGYDCGDCNDSWDGSNTAELCYDMPCMPLYDANGDGIVNILDVILGVGLILGTGDMDCSIDYDNDGEINVLDIVIMVNIILEGDA